LTCSESYSITIRI